MLSLQYTIDTICASFTADSIYHLIKDRLRQGPFNPEDIVPEIQNKDRSLDKGSARTIAEVGLKDLAGQGVLRLDGETVAPL